MFDPVTAEPFPERVRRVAQWPRTRCKALTNAGPMGWMQRMKFPLLRAQKEK